MTHRCDVAIYGGRVFLQSVQREDLHADHDDKSDEWSLSESGHRVFRCRQFDSLLIFIRARYLEDASE